MEETRADVSQTGAATVPAHTLYDIARKLPDGAQVEIRRDNEKERLILASGHSRFTLQTLAPEDFPDLSPGELGHRFEIGASDLKRLIEKTRFAISTEETRYYLNGIYLHPADAGRARRRCAPWPPTAIVWRRPSCRCRRAPTACPASSCRARRCTSCTG